MSMRLTVNLASPCLFSFLVTAVYLLTCRLYINWAHSIMAAVIIITVQQNWCLPFEHDCLYLLALALFFLCALVNILSVQSYSTALIWVCPQCTLLFFYQALMSFFGYMVRNLVFSEVRLFVNIMFAWLSYIGDYITDC